MAASAKYAKCSVDPGSGKGGCVEWVGVLADNAHTDIQPDMRNLQPDSQIFIVSGCMLRMSGSPSG